MAVIVKGECYLYQDEETIPHVTLEMVSSFINQIHRSRRVVRGFSNEELNTKYLKFPSEAYGFEGEYYYKDDYQESIEEINYRGTNPSLHMPFYVEKDKNNHYILKCIDFPEANSFESITNWINIIMRTYVYSTGMYLDGNLIISDDETKQVKKYKFNKEKCLVKIGKDNPKTLITREIFLNSIQNNKRAKKRYTPEIFEYISKNIDEGKLNKDFNFNEN